MRVIAKSRLRLFWESSSAYADAAVPMTEWYRHMEKVRYHTAGTESGVEDSQHPQGWGAYLTSLAISTG